jgi:hypothetical protein
MTETESIAPEQTDGDLAELVPVFRHGIEQQRPEAREAFVAAEDILFGEVIDISDLIARLAPELAAPGIEAMEMSANVDPGVAEVHAAMAVHEHPGVLTFLYDDEILASGGGVL